MPRKRIILLVAIPVLILLIFISARVLQSRSLFEVTATSGSVAGLLKIDAGLTTTHVGWPLGAADIRSGSSSDTFSFTEPGGQLRITGPVHITIEELRDGTVVVQLRQAGDHPFRASILTPDREEATLPAPVFARLQSGSPHLLVFNASELTIGEALDSNTSRRIPALEHGQIEVLGRTIIESRVYPGSRTRLSVGDVVRFRDTRGDAGVIVQTGEGPLNIFARANAGAAVVGGYNTELREVRLSVVDMLINDRLFAAFWSLLAVGAGILGIFWGK